eukprot:CAMPEP_0202697284 /NCGR_PEP_ID=MMETSP1385-20130828/10618_1 /ASSEMBLY_ACC=CAM_ASM_000861 /TAXON_ID=933848 /ORGANISM="Elphidium margaritaceum" /LENGTH=113 /DNA_ID=CAMNT_0049353707 /DNA_START=46 /DNA_END=387 /DNA_ORIENTATION=-
MSNPESEVEKVGNPICESCEEDRKNAGQNASLMKKDECYPLFQKVEECGKISGHRVQACFKEWREFAMCKKHWIAKERNIIYNTPKAPDSWLKRHPEFVHSDYDREKYDNYGK